MSMKLRLRILGNPKDNNNKYQDVDIDTSWVMDVRIGDCDQMIAISTDDDGTLIVRAPEGVLVLEPRSSNMMLIKVRSLTQEVDR